MVILSARYYAELPFLIDVETYQQTCFEQMRAIYERNRDDLLIAKLYCKTLMCAITFLGFGGIFEKLEDGAMKRQLDEALEVKKHILKIHGVEVYKTAFLYATFAGPTNLIGWQEFFTQTRKLCSEHPGTMIATRLRLVIATQLNQMNAIEHAQIELNQAADQIQGCYKTMPYGWLLWSLVHTKKLEVLQRTQFFEEQKKAVAAC
jgi:hypothetical protein